jgi:hypothetical protein
MHTTNLQADGDYVDEIPGPVVVDQILHKRVIMDEVWIVSESPCTDQLEHRTEAQPEPKKGTDVKGTDVVNMTDNISGEELDDMNDENYEPVYANDDDNDKNMHVQNDDYNREEFEQFVLWRQNGKPAAVKTSKSKTGKGSSKSKTSSKSSSKHANGTTTSKSRSEGSGVRSKKERPHFDSALSGSEEEKPARRR